MVHRCGAWPFARFKLIVQAEQRWIQMLASILVAGLWFAAKRRSGHLDRFMTDGEPGHAAEVAGCLAFVCGLSAIHHDDAALVAAGVTVQGSRATRGRPDGAARRALYDYGLSHLRHSAIEGDGQTAGLTSIRAYARFLDCLNAALSGDDTRLLAARGALTELGADDFRWLVEVVDFWLGADLSREERGEAFDWLDGPDAARTRWRRLVADRRGSLARQDVTPEG